MHLLVILYTVNVRYLVRVKQVPHLYKTADKITMVVLYILEVNNLCFMQGNKIFSAQ